MKKIRFGRRGAVACAATVAALALAGGIAYATIPGPDNVYSACMLKGVGTVRLIDKSLPSTNLVSHCTDKEIAISWNQAGQPGPPGPAGAKASRVRPGRTARTEPTGRTAHLGPTARTEPTARTASASRPHPSRRAQTAPTAASSSQP